MEKYSIMDITDNTKMYTWKLLRESVLKILITRKRTVTMCDEVSDF